MACDVVLSWVRYACSCLVAFSRPTLCVVLLVRGTSQSPDFYLTLLMMGVARYLIWTSFGWCIVTPHWCG